MKLLIVTQAVDADHQALGFFIEWLRTFAQQCDSVDVIAFQVGRHDLPTNVQVHDARAWGTGALARLARYWQLLATLLPKNDALFVHMSPEYMIGAWPFLLGRNKPAVLWYAHRSVTRRLRLADAISSAVVTSAEGAYRLPTKKRTVVGQGVPSAIFRPMKSVTRDHRIITVGRLTAIKRLELMIEALALIRAQGILATLDIAGEAVYEEDARYLASIRARIEELHLGQAVKFLGIVPHGEFPVRYAQYALAFNMAPTGAPDKAALEAMACGVPVVVSNANFRQLLGADADRCVAEPDAASVAQKASALLNERDEVLTERLRAIVVRDHSLETLVQRILKVITSLT